MSVSKRSTHPKTSVVVSGLAALAILSTASPYLAKATENGATEYPLGADSFDDALTPPPGTGVLLSYNTYVDGPVYSGGTAIKGSHISVLVSAFRGIYTWPGVYDDGKVTISSEIVIGGGNIHLKVPTPVGPLANGSTGLIDPSFWPVDVNYHSGPIFGAATFVIWAPLGTYNKTAVPAKGLGDNHYTFAPVFYLTYMVSPVLQLDLASVTEFSTVNPNRQYTSGDDETLTASLSYRVTPALQVGPTGYLYVRLRQVEFEREAGKVRELTAVAAVVAVSLAQLRTRLLAVPSEHAPGLVRLTAETYMRTALSQSLDEALAGLIDPQRLWPAANKAHGGNLPSLSFTNIAHRYGLPRAERRAV